MKVKILLFFAILLSYSLHSQNSIKPSDVIYNFKVKYQPKTFAPFTASTHRDLNLPSELDNYKAFNLDKNKLNEVVQRNDQFIQLSFPYIDRDIQVELVQVDFMKGVDYVVLQPSGKEVKVNTGKHYQGIVKGDYNSLVAISIFDDEVSGFISSSRYSDLEIGRLEDKSAHIMYKTSDLIHHYDLDCGTHDDGVDYREEELHYEHNHRSDNCVELYIEVDYDIYQNKGGTVGTSSFVTGFMNQVIAMYANENITCTLNPLFIWSSTSPYSGTQSSALLSQFQNYRNSWEGTLAGLVSFQASGGIAAGFNGICNSNRDNSMSFSSINANFSNVPTYSWTVDVVTHEFGHIFGSRHTHACVWNGNNTAIDGCAGYTEGSCSQPGNPSGGGTVMSYCHAASVGKNLSLGFGSQPGNVIRYNVNNSSCLSSCDGSGGAGTSCENNEVTINIITDNYGSETSWTLADSSGTTIAAGSGYSNNTTYNLDQCLVDGCYTFTINDSYGDGICCNYGSGSYSVTFDGTTLASGGEFTNSEATNFCVTGSGGADTEAPSNPTNLTYSNLQETSVTLSWNASSDNVGVQGYNIFNNGSNIGQVTGTSSNITGLTPETTYTFYVNAYDAAGNVSGQSNTITVTTPAAPDTQAPSNPTNLTSSNLQETSVTLSWNASSDNVGVQGYNIFSNGSNIGQVIGTSSNITGLTPETTYTFYVNAYDAAGNVSGQSNTITVTTPAAPDTQAPSNPTNLTSSNLEETSVTLSWNASSDNVGVQGYNIYRNGNNIGQVTGTSSNITGLTPETTYTFYVNAYDAAGNVSGQSNTITVTTPAAPDTQAPSDPTNLTSSNLQETSVTLSWNASSDNVGVQGYNIYRNGNNIGQATGISSNITGLTPETTYTFYVNAYDAAGNVSGQSNTITVTTPAAPDTQAPSDPTNLTSSNLEETSVTLSWNASSDNVGVQGYNIYRNGNNIGQVTGTSSNITGLTPETTYTFYVNAYDAEGNVSGQSNTITVTTPAAPDTQAPSNPTNLTSSNLQETSVTLSWNASSDNVGVQGYNIFSNGNNIGQVTGTSSNITGLTPETTYTFYVNAYDAAGNVSGQSNTITVTTPGSPVTYCDLSGNNAAYEWIDYVGLNNMTNSTGSDGGYADYTSLVANAPYGSNTVYVSAGFSGSNYREYWSIWIDLNHDGTFSTSERLAYGSSTSSGTLSANITIPTTATAGSTRMRIAMKYNTSSSSSCGTFTYGEVEDYTVVIGGSSQNGLPISHGITDVLENVDVVDYKIYPNPLTEQNFRVEMTDVEEIDYTIYNSLGEQIQKGHITRHDNSITLDQMDRGIYLIEFSDGIKTELRKLIKQ